MYIIYCFPRGVLFSSAAAAAGDDVFFQYAVRLYRRCHITIYYYYCACVVRFPSTIIICYVFFFFTFHMTRYKQFWGWWMKMLNSIPSLPLAVTTLHTLTVRKNNIYYFCFHTLAIFYKFWIDPQTRCVKHHNIVNILFVWIAKHPHLIFYSKCIA